MGTQAPKGTAQRPGQPARKAGFLDSLAALFSSDDPERIKQKRLREIASELKRGRTRYYSPQKGTTEPALPPVPRGTSSTAAERVTVSLEPVFASRSALP